MEDKYKNLLNGNKIWALSRLQEDSEYFIKHQDTQTPAFLWIGCSDSRVPANAITSTSAGDIFVHRNIANLVVTDDVNMLSVVAYAVQYLKIKHIIICGHYGCGGVLASMEDTSFGFVDKWLKHIKQVAVRHQKELDAISDKTLRANRLVELNVLQQVENLAQTEIVKDALSKKIVKIHGWVYGLNDGIINDLKVHE